jgi:hypothetical protein
LTSSTTRHFKESTDYLTHVFLQFIVVHGQIGLVARTQVLQNGQYVVFADTVVMKAERLHKIVALGTFVMYVHTPFVETHTAHLDDTVETLLVRAGFTIDHHCGRDGQSTDVAFMRFRLRVRLGGLTLRFRALLLGHVRRLAGCAAVWLQECAS